jgi:hypothetical protein
LRLAHGETIRQSLYSVRKICVNVAAIARFLGAMLS